MKIKLIFILMTLANVLYAQTVTYLNEDFSWIDKDTTFITKIKLEDSGDFELIEDSFYDCSPAFVIYGRGKYQVIKDTIHFVFDSIPTLQSECKIDSISNEGEYSGLMITVFDQRGENIKDVELHWGMPKKKRRWVTTQFFEEQFDDEIELKFSKDEKVDFVRIEKEGYYQMEIPVPEYPIKDYKVEVILRPKPKVKSRYYISNTEGKSAIISGCEIQYFDKRKLKKESCH